MIKPLTMTTPPSSDAGIAARTPMHPERPDRIGQLGAGLGALSLILAIATLIQVSSNSDLRATAVQGQAQVAKAQALANVDNELVGLLAKAAAENHDDAIRTLLAQNGVTFKAAPPSAAPSSNPTN